MRFTAKFNRVYVLKFEFNVEGKKQVLFQYHPDRMACHSHAKAYILYRYSLNELDHDDMKEYCALFNEGIVQYTITGYVEQFPSYEDGIPQGWVTAH